MHFTGVIFIFYCTFYRTFLRRYSSALFNPGRNLLKVQRFLFGLQRNKDFFTVNVIILRFPEMANH